MIIETSDVDLNASVNTNKDYNPSVKEDQITG